MIAPYHLEAIRALPNCHPIGIMDNGSGAGQRLAPGLDPRGAADLDDFLARPDLDIVTIATPSGTHGEIAVRAAAAGKHCIVEKPLEINVARIDEMIAAHETAGTRLGGIFNSRYTAAAQALREASAAGRFGAITFASVTGPWWRDQGYYDGSPWKGTRALDGGGAVMNQGVHSVDLLQWIAGMPVVTVRAYTARLTHERIETEDTAAALLVFSNGALGTLSCATSMWPGHFRTLTLSGDRGTAVLADDRLLLWEFAEEVESDARIRAELVGSPGKGVGASNPSAGVTSEGHRRVFEDFIAALGSGRRPEIDGHECRKAVSLIEAVYRSAERGGEAVSPP